MTRLDYSGSLAIITLDDGQGNQLSLDMVNTIDQYLDAILKSTATAVVLTGEGPNFIGGADFVTTATVGKPHTDIFLPKVSQLLQRLLTLEMPLVGALNGGAVAVGVAIASTCDYRVLTNTNAELTIGGLNLGLPNLVTMLEVVRGVMPPSIFQSSLYLTTPLHPQDALQYGLADRLAEPNLVLSEAKTIAAQLGKLERPAFLLTKRQLRQPIVERIERYTARWDNDVIAYWGSSETQQRNLALLERLSSRQNDEQTTRTGQGLTQAQGAGSSAAMTGISADSPSTTIRLVDTIQSATTSLLDSIRVATKSIPGSEVFLSPALSGMSHVVQSSSKTAKGFAKVGRGLAGWPGEFPSAVVGAGVGAVTGTLTSFLPRPGS